MRKRAVSFGVLAALTTVMGLATPARADSIIGFTKTTYDIIDASGTNCVVGTDTGDMIFEHVLTASEVADMQNALATGGTVTLIADTHADAAGTAEGAASTAFRARLRFLVLDVSSGNVYSLRRTTDSQSAPPDFNRNNHYEIPLGTFVVNRLAAGDTFRVRATGSGIADPNPCGDFEDSPATHFTFGQSNPYIFVDNP